MGKNVISMLKSKKKVSSIYYFFHSADNLQEYGKRKLEDIYTFVSMSWIEITSIWK